jgi:hypothetical protein
MEMRCAHTLYLRVFVRTNLARPFSLARCIG